MHVGDFITLKTLKHQAWLSAEGILVENVNVSSSTKLFEEHLFQIYVQRQYSATNELEQFIKTHTSDVNNPESSNRNHYDALLRGKENETNLNYNVMKSKIGNRLCFGDIIQLMHVKSRKFITVRPNTAQDERENMQVFLSSDGSVLSWIKVLPRYKINKEGDVITNNTELLLKISERSNEYVHCADRKPVKSKLREVNSSLEQTPWRINIFQRADEVANKPLLLTGQLVYIRDPESLSILSPISYPVCINRDKLAYIHRQGSNSNQIVAMTPLVRSVSNSEYDEVQLAHQNVLPPNILLSRQIKDSFNDLSFHSAKSEGVLSMDSSDLDFTRPLTAEGDDQSLTSVEEFVAENGDAVLSPMEEDNLKTDCIFMMESKLITKGGVLKFRSDTVRFRHFNSGKYLAVVEEPEGSEHFIIKFVHDPIEKATLFCVSELHSSEELLHNAKAMQIMHQYFGVYLERGTYHDQSKVYSMNCTRNKSKAVNIIINRYKQADFTIQSTNNTVNSVVRPAEVVLDIYFGKAVMQTIDRFVKFANIPKSASQGASETSVWPKIDAADRPMFSSTLARTALFVKGYPILLDNVSISSFKTDKSIIARRQNMFRQQGLIQNVLVLLNLMKPISSWAAMDASTSRLQNVQFIQSGRQVISECLNMLYDLVKNNLENQLYIADHLLVILSHVSTDKMAAKVAQELLSGNRELQETKIGSKEITIFAEKMREVPMNSLYLQLLQTCCSCLGQSVPKNQEIVEHILFQKYRDILISLSVDSSSLNTQTDWLVTSNDYQLFIANTAISLMLARNLIEDGIPSVNLSWMTRSTRYSAQRLFGRSSVSLQEVFRPVHPNMLRARAPRFSTAQVATNEQKKAVGDFFIAQLQLCAELCLGRNYPVMVELEKIYTYNALVTITKSSFSDALQGAAAYLILNLYVDRDPQNQIQLPRLTRTWTEIIQSNLQHVELVGVESTQVYKFGLLQFIISNHLNKIQGKPFPPQTSNYMKLLHKLVDFSFYGDVGKMKHVIVQLVGCLRRDADDINSDGDNTNGALTAAMNSKFGKTPSALSSKKLGVSAKNQGLGNSGTMAKGMSVRGLEDIDSSENADEFGNQRNADWQGSNNEIDGMNDDQSKGSGFLGGMSFRSKSASNLTKERISEASGGGLIFSREHANQLLLFLESFWFNVGLTVLILIAVILSYYHTEAHDSPMGYVIMDEVVIAILVFEIILQFFLHVYIHRNLFSFFWNINNFVNIVAIVVFVMLRFLVNNGYGKAIRLLNIINLIRLYIAQLQRKDSYQPIYDAWSEPERYFKTPEYTLQTMIKVLQILCSIQRNLEDRSLSLFLQAFSVCVEDPQTSVEQVEEIFERVVTQSKDLTVSSAEYDEIYLDLLMYNYPDLVQNTLELLMNHHSSTKILMDNILRLQLITTSSGENQYVRTQLILSILKSDAETHELWGRLQQPDHIQRNNQMHNYLLELIQNCKRYREYFHFDESEEPIKSAQNILKNLGCYDICLKIIQLIGFIDPDHAHHEHHVNTRNLALKCSRLLYWFILDNPTNQVLAYRDLDYFIRMIDERIETHNIIKAIFRNNNELIESVPKRYIAESVDMICNIGRFPQYLSLMTSVIAVGEKNVIANQYEVIRLMSSPENIKKVVSFFTSVKHSEYAKKIRYMQPHLNEVDISIDQLPPDLGYHLELMGLLSGCSIGRSGMTTIEAKVQSMFSFVDVVEAMLDPQCLLLAKVRLGLFFYHSMIDVETSTPNLRDADCVWKLLYSMLEIFSFAKDDLRNIEKNGWSSPTSNRQKVEYVMVCLMIIEGYFSSYYDSSVFRPELSHNTGIERVQIREVQANQLIKSLFTKIMSIYEMVSPLLTEEHHMLLFNTLNVLNNKASSRITANVEKIHERFIIPPNEFAVDIDQKREKDFEEFVKHLQSSDTLQKLVSEQEVDFINALERIPLKTADSPNPVRFEALIDKFVSHIRQSIQTVVHGDETAKFLESRVTRTGIWVVKQLRSMIEKRWGKDIFGRDEDGEDDDDDKVADLMIIFNSSGVVEMCLELIAKGIEFRFQVEAIKLLVAMLLKEGGAIDIQRTIYAHLSKPGSELFFRTVRGIIQSLITWHRWSGIINLEEGKEPDLPEEIILIRCLQLFCEGHFLPNQDILREQSQNSITINLLDDFVTYLQTIDGLKCRTSTVAEFKVTATILEVIQGPCEGNQNYFALNTELIETLNRMLRQRPVNDCNEDEEIELKKVTIDILQALLEGQASKTAIYERMLSVIHIDVIQVLASGTAQLVNYSNDSDSSAMLGEESDEAIELSSESMVLMRMLIDFRPSLKKELGIDDSDISAASESVACVEVVWRGELQRRFFHVPDICNALAPSTREHFVRTVKRASPEDKLYGLMEASKEMYREILHQNTLKSYNVDQIFSRTVIDKVTWFTFIVVVVLEILCICSYTAPYYPCEFPMHRRMISSNAMVPLHTTYNDYQFANEYGTDRLQLDSSNQLLESYFIEYEDTEEYQDLENSPNVRMSNRMSIHGVEESLSGDYYRWLWGSYNESESFDGYDIDPTWLHTPNTPIVWTSYHRVLQSNGSNSSVINCAIVNATMFNSTNSSYYNSSYYNLTNSTNSSMPINCTSNATIPTITDSFICSTVYYINSKINPAITGLNIIIILLSIFTLAAYIVVKVPVTFKTHSENGLNFFQSIVYTATDPIPLYYLGYVILAIAGYYHRELLTLLLLDFIMKSSTAQNVLLAVYGPRRQIFMTLVLLLILTYILTTYQFFFFNGVNNINNDGSSNLPQNSITLLNFFKFLVRWGVPYGTPQNYVVFTIYTYRVITDVIFFLVTQIMLNVVKGIVIDTFIALRKSNEAKKEDMEEKCFICGIEKNTFNRMLDRDAFRNHIKYDQNMWNYIFFIIFIWEQSKDDDDGLETYVRRCIESSDLSWFPMNKAIRMAEHQKKGDTNSLKYRLRQELHGTENTVHQRMNFFKEQLNRTIVRVEKAIEFEPEQMEVIRKSRTITAGPVARVGNAPGSGSSTVSISAQNSVSSNAQGGRLSIGKGNNSNTKSPKNVTMTPSERSNSGSRNELVEQMSSPIRRVPSKTNSNKLVVVTQEGNESNVLISRASKALSESTKNISNSTEIRSTHQRRLSLIQYSKGVQNKQQKAYEVTPFTAFEEDALILMHLKIISISGLLSVPVEKIVLRVTSEYETSTLIPEAVVRELEPIHIPPKTTNKGLESERCANSPDKEMKSKDKLSRSRRNTNDGTERKSFDSLEGLAGLLMHKSFVFFGVDSPNHAIMDSNNDPMDRPSLIIDPTMDGPYHKKRNGPKLYSMNFDSLSNPTTMVHQGHLPNVDLSRHIVKIQVLMEEGPYLKFIGGINVSIFDLLSKSDANGTVENEIVLNHQPVPSERTQNPTIRSPRVEDSLVVNDLDDEHVPGTGLLPSRVLSPAHKARLLKASPSQPPLNPNIMKLEPISRHPKKRRDRRESFTDESDGWTEDPTHVPCTLKMSVICSPELLNDWKRISSF